MRGGSRLRQLPVWQRGDSSSQIEAGQCLLKQRGLFDPQISGHFDAATAHGVGTYKERRGLEVTRKLNAQSWTSLFAGGSSPLVKRGSANDRVRFLERALTAACRGRPPSTACSAAVRRMR